jgi:FdhD protein
MIIDQGGYSEGIFRGQRATQSNHLDGAPDNKAGQVAHMSHSDGCSVEVSCYADDSFRTMQCAVPVEQEIILSVNGKALVRLMCTPTQLQALAIGFLFNEGLIESTDDVAAIGSCKNGRGLDVWLDYDIDVDRPRAITSGCSGGTTFADIEAERDRIVSDLHIASRQVKALMEALTNAAARYRRSGGIHAAALAALNREAALIYVAEDIGRHNTLDKIAGLCLQQGYDTRDHVLLTSGRVSSEMINKAVRMTIPILISRTSPTHRSIQLAKAWGITLIGYARGSRFRVYTCQHRVTEVRR